MFPSTNDSLLIHKWLYRAAVSNDLVEIFETVHSLLMKEILFTGNMAAFDMNDPQAVVSPGGVGFDINCGVRLLRTNLFAKDVLPIKVHALRTYAIMEVFNLSYCHDSVTCPRSILRKVYSIIFQSVWDLKESFRWTLKIWKKHWKWEWTGHFGRVIRYHLPFCSSYIVVFVVSVESFIAGYIWAEDKEHCEEYGRMLNADPAKVSLRAKKRGLPQVSISLSVVLLIHALSGDSWVWTAFYQSWKTCVYNDKLRSSIR